MDVKNVSVLAYHREGGLMEPLRFKLDGKQYKVDELTDQYLDRRNGNQINCYKYRRSDGKTYELKYEKDTMKWTLWM